MTHAGAQRCNFTIEDCWLPLVGTVLLQKQIQHIFYVSVLYSIVWYVSAKGMDLQYVIRMIYNYGFIYSTIQYRSVSCHAANNISVSILAAIQDPSFGVACRHFEDRGETVLGSCLPCFYLFNIVVWSTMFAFGFKVFLVSCIEQYCSVFFWKPIQNNAVRIWRNIWDIWYIIYNTVYNVQ